MIKAYNSKKNQTVIADRIIFPYEDWMITWDKYGKSYRCTANRNDTEEVWTADYKDPLQPFLVIKERIDKMLQKGV